MGDRAETACSKGKDLLEGGKVCKIDEKRAWKKKANHRLKEREEKGKKSPSYPLRGGAGLEKTPKQKS